MFGDPYVAGLAAMAWVQLHRSCVQVDGFGGLVRTEWPDGGSALEQPAIVVDMFDLITDERAKAIAEAGKTRG